MGITTVDKAQSPATPPETMLSPTVDLDEKVSNRGGGGGEGVIRILM